MIREAFLIAVAAVTPAVASFQPGSLVSIKSVSELVLRVDAKAITVRVPNVALSAQCAGLVALARDVLPQGSPAKLHFEAGRPRIYFELANGEQVEWTRLIVAGGIATYGGQDDELREAEQAARTAGLGLWGGCTDEDPFTRVAREKNVSRRLLYAVALAESGRAGTPWPWTLNVSGRSFYYETRDKAHQALVGFLRAGYRSIDVGYMQVNLAYNGRRFANTWQALDPHTNLIAAAEILQENFLESRDVRLAVGNYHSRTPWRSRDYYQRVARHYVSQIPKEKNQ